MFMTYRQVIKKQSPIHQTEKMYNFVEESLKSKRRRQRKWMITCEKQLLAASVSYTNAKHAVYKIDKELKALQQSKKTTKSSN